MNKHVYITKVHLFNMNNDDDDDNDNNTTNSINNK